METPEQYQRHQRQLLDQSRRIFQKTPISRATENAYLATPRHWFVRRYREWGKPEWQPVTAGNLEQHLAVLYADRPLVLFGDEDNNALSTISQPSFVLRMLDMLQLQPGQTVFELGAGSGWNAALMGRLVGSAGRVFSLEIIPEVARAATEAVQAAGITNVSIVVADGGDGYPAGSPYDRAIFTAGTYDLPHSFFEQIKDGGLLMAVIKLEGGGDTLFLLRKIKDHFESVDSVGCAFVQLRGKHQIEGLNPVVLNTLPEWAYLQNKEVSRIRFWWGGKGPESFVWRTAAIRFFLAISEPHFRAFKTEKIAGRPMEDHYFGLRDQEQRSLVLAKDDWLITYGNPSVTERFLKRVRQWVDLGMPASAGFKLQVYPNDRLPAVHDRQWIVKRNGSTFLWSLEA
jgi:protein-L-isoaspartate(D-aspartate) O-methyltransferase